MDAQIWITGRVGSEVDYRVVNDTFSVASFRMACTPRVQRNGEWTDEPTTWVSVRCGRTLAEGAKCSLIKGDPVVVVGKLRTHTWTDVDGVVHEQLRIEAITVGHDLTQGTSAFRRLRRATYDAGVTASEIVGADSTDGEEQPAEELGEESVRAAVLVG